MARNDRVERATVATCNDLVLTDDDAADDDEEDDHLLTLSLSPHHCLSVPSMLLIVSHCITQRVIATPGYKNLTPNLLQHHSALQTSTPSAEHRWESRGGFPCPRRLHATKGHPGHQGQGRGDHPGGPNFPPGCSHLGSALLLVVCSLLCSALLFTVKTHLTAPVTQWWSALCSEPSSPKQT